MTERFQALNFVTQFPGFQYSWVGRWLVVDWDRMSQAIKIS